MKYNQWIVLGVIILGQSAFANNQLCMEMIPEKRDYIVSAELLRQVIDCVEKVLPKPVEPNTLNSAMRYDERTYMLPIQGQSTLYIRQLNLFEQTYSYEIRLLSYEGKVIKTLTIPFKNKREEKIELKKLTGITPAYIIVTVLKKDIQKAPLTMIYAV